jgi:hypothetical protein
MLTLADLCIFVTSASRYADAIPFEFLSSANRQGVPTLFVLNKAPTDPWLAVDLVNDFAARLSRRGLLPAPNPNLIFRLTHDPLPRTHQGLDASAISALREELDALADPDFREEIMRQTTSASLRAIGDLGAELAADLRVDSAQAADLREAVGDAYVEQSLRLEEELDSGAFAAVARRKSSTEAAAELAGIVTRRAGVASGRAAGSWERLPGGAILLGRGGAGLYRHGEDTPFEAVEIIEEWEQAAARHAAAEASGRSSRRTRRRLGRFLWRAALDPDRKAPGAVARRFDGDTDKIVLAAREMLTAAFVAALGHDAERFRELIRDPVPDDRITALEETIAELVRITGDPSTDSLDPQPVSAAPAATPTTPALTTPADAPRGSTSA